MARPRKAETSRITVYLSPEIKERLDKEVGGEYGKQSEVIQDLLAGWLKRKEGERSITVILPKETADALDIVLSHTDMGIENTIIRMIMTEARTYTEGGGQRQRIGKVLEMQEEILRIIKEKYEPPV